VQKCDLKPLQYENMTYKAFIDYEEHKKMESSKILPTYVAKMTSMEKIVEVNVVNFVPEVIVNEQVITIETIKNELVTDYHSNGIKLEITDDPILITTGELQKKEVKIIKPEMYTATLECNMSPKEVRQLCSRFDDYLKLKGPTEAHFNSYRKNQSSVDVMHKQKRVRSLFFPRVIKNFLCPGSYLKGNDIAQRYIYNLNAYEYDGSPQEQKLQFLDDCDKKNLRNCFVLNDTWLTTLTDYSVFKGYELFYIGGKTPWVFHRCDNKDDITLLTYTSSAFSILRNMLVKYAMMFGLLIRYNVDPKNYTEKLESVFRGSALIRHSFHCNYELWTQSVLKIKLKTSPDRFFEGTSLDFSGFVDGDLDAFLREIETSDGTNRNREFESVDNRDLVKNEGGEQGVDLKKVEQLEQEGLDDLFKESPGDDI
jgi:hypothetical protein